MDSLELFVRVIDDFKYQEQNQQVKQYIKLITERLNLPTSIADTFKRAASLHYNFETLLEKKLKSESKVHVWISIRLK